MVIGSKGSRDLHRVTGLPSDRSGTLPGLVLLLMYHSVLWTFGAEDDSASSAGHSRCVESSCGFAGRRRALGMEGVGDVVGGAEGKMHTLLHPWSGPYRCC